MRNLLDAIVVIVLSFVIVLHIAKILNIVFKPSVFKKIFAITNKNLSDWQLVLYYSITILALLSFLYNKFILKAY